MAVIELNGTFSGFKTTKMSETYTKRVIFLKEKDTIFEIEVSDKKVDSVRPIVQKLKEGEKIQVKAFVNSREWKDKYFTILSLAELYQMHSTAKAPTESSAVKDDLPF